MNGTAPRIEILNPFNDAFALMKKILFQPFDLKKWFVIGFASFLAGHIGGLTPPIGGFQQHQPKPIPSWMPLEQLRPWMPLIIIGFFVAIFLIVIVMMWLRARGNFVFTDCIVRDRGAIAQPWREYRKEGNSFFKFQLGVMFAALIAFVIFGIIVVSLGLFPSRWERTSGIILAIGFAFLFILWVAISIFIALVYQFMPLVMYVRRSTAVDAFREVVALIADHPGPFILFIFFGIVLLLGTMLAAGIVTCATCFIAALPYVGTVICLPIYLWLRAFSLLFLRQFGTDYDVWQTLPLPSVPPIQTPPPLPPT